MPITVSEGGEWIERLAIAELIYRYSDSVTRADWDQTEAVFAPDATWESPALGLRFEGARPFRDFLAETTGNDLLIQTAHPPVIAFWVLRRRRRRRPFTNLYEAKFTLTAHSAKPGPR